MTSIPLDTFKAVYRSPNLVKDINYRPSRQNKIRKKYDLTIILISHDFEMVKKYADKVVLLDKTIKKQGSPKEVFSSREFGELF